MGVGDDTTRPFRIVSANQATIPIATMCRVLGVSESGFHAWQARAPAARSQRDTAIRVAIRAAHARSDGTYGAPRILEDLREAGYRVGRAYFGDSDHLFRAKSISCFAPCRSPVSVDADQG